MLASWSDHEDAGQQVIALAATVSHPVYIITSFGPTFKGPPLSEGNPFSAIEKFANNLPSHVVFVVDVGTGRVERLIVTLYQRLNPRIQKRSRFADTLDDALALIEQDKSNSANL